MGLGAAALGAAGRAAGGRAGRYNERAGGRADRHGQADTRRRLKVSPPPQGGVGRGLRAAQTSGTDTDTDTDGPGRADRRTDAGRAAGRGAGRAAGGAGGGALFLGLLSGAIVAARALHPASDNCNGLIFSDLQATENQATRKRASFRDAYGLTAGKVLPFGLGATAQS